MNKNESAQIFHCPYCRGKRFQVETNTNLTTFMRFFIYKVENTNMRFWQCQNCRGIFPFPQDLQAEAQVFQKGEKSAKSGGIICVILGVLAFPFVAGCPISSSVIAFLIIPWVMSALFFSIASSQAKEADRIYKEYTKLISKCMDD